MALATAAAAALRLPFLGTQSLWYDETFTRAVVTSPSLAGVWHGVKATEATPPLYYVLTWAAGKVFGGMGSDAALRATSAIASVACVPAAFAATRRFAGDVGGLGAAALVAASPVLAWYALDARAYSLLVLLSLLSLWAVGLLLERPTRARWVAWAFAAAAALWTHYFAAFLVAAEALVLLYRLPATRRAAIASCALVAALIAPLVPVLAAQSDSRTDHIGSLSLLDRTEQAGRQYAMGPNVPRAWLEALGLALAVGGFAAGLAAARRARALRPLAAVAALAIGVPLLLSLTGLLDRFFLRNVLMAWGAVAAIAAVGLLRARAVPLVVYLALGVVTIVWVESDWRYQNADWRGAVRSLGHQADGTTVVGYPAFNAPVAARYLSRPIVPGPVDARHLWVMIEPARTDRRDLTPAPLLPRLPPGFARGTEIDHHGFRILALDRPLPGTVPVSRGSFGQDVLGEPPALFPPPSGVVLGAGRPGG